MNDPRAPTAPGAGEFGVWEIDAPTAPVLPALAADAECDTLVVGAGYTGLSAALHLRERGIDCLVIEAREPGWGASGRNTGWLEPNWWMATPAQIAARHGAGRGAELSRLVAAGPRLLEAWCARFGLEIGLRGGGLALVSTARAQIERWQGEAAHWQALGVANRALSAAEVCELIATERYSGGFLLADGATLNPLALARELARACLQQGVRLHARSPATHIERRDNAWQARTPAATVRARRLVLATDAYTGALWPALRRAFATWHVALVASMPYPGLPALLPRGIPVADMGLANIFTLREAAGQRIATTTFAPLRRGLGAERIAAPFERKFRRVFPEAPLPRWEHVHFGEIGISHDMLPHLCRIGPEAWTAYGYSGTGINLALLLGGEIARAIAADPQDPVRFPVEELRPLPAYRLTGAALRWLHAPLSRHLVSRLA